MIWLLATLKLGVPMTAMSWLMFNWLYGAGDLSRDAGHKAIREQLTHLKKHHKTTRTKRGNYLYRQWMLFGSGFYGLAILWTLLVIEVSEVIVFFMNFDLEHLLADGVVAMLITLAAAQIGNIVSALLWFGYWPDAGEAVIPWVIIAYLGYLFGIHLARERQTLHRWSDLWKRK